MTNRLVVLLTLPWLALGCAAPSDGDLNSDVHRDRDRAAVCARSWKAKGFTFDPNTMTCAQMFEQAQAIRNAAYWKQQGYAFDPNAMTAKEMDRKAEELRKMGVQQYPSASATQTQTTASEVAPVRAAAETKAPIQPQDVETRQMLEKMNIAQVRKRYPQYDDMDDMELAHGIHDRYFRDVPFADFARQFLGDPP
jgi:Tfp pilus assembly protein PilP